MLLRVDRSFMDRLVAGILKQASEPDRKDLSLKGLQLALPALFAGGAGAAYGAYQAPGGSPLRGALAGGLAGAGAGAGLTGVHQFLSSPYGAQFQSPGANTALMLGGAGLAGYGGLQAGRKLSDRLKLPDKDKDDELSELDLIHRGRSVLPAELGGYFGLKAR